MLPLSMEKSTQSRTAITPFAAFLMGDRPPLRTGGGYNDLVFFVSVLPGQLTSQGVASPGAFSAFKSTPEASLDAFSTFGSAPEASPAYFQPSKVLPKPRLAYFQPSKVLPKPHLARFQPSGVLPRLSSQCCALLTEFSSKTRALFLPQGVTLRQKHFQFGSNKNHHKSRSYL